MRSLAALPLLAALWSPAALADEAGYNLAKGFAIGGLVSGLAVGPGITIGATVATVNSAANNIEGDGTSQGLINGAAGILVGVTITAISPAVVVGSGAAGNLAVRDMGGSPSLIPTFVGLGGIAVQAGGWAWTVTQANKTNPNIGGPTATRWIGWTTAMVGGGIQLAVNGKAARSARNLGALEHRSQLRLGLTAVPGGGGVIGVF